MHLLKEPRVANALSTAGEPLRLFYPTDDIARLLGVDSDMPMFRITSICYLADGTPIEHAHGYHRGDRSQFEVELFRVIDSGSADASIAGGDSLPHGHTLIR